MENKIQTKKEFKTLSIEVPFDSTVSAEYSNSILTVKGPKGEVSKKLKFPRVQISVENNNIIISTMHLTQREKKIMHTYRAHVKNLVKGVMYGFEYKLGVFFAKFPVTLEFKSNVFIVKNLLGEKVPRTAQISTDVKVEIKDGKEIIVSGIDIEKCGQVAATLEQLTTVRNMDRRVVQDGIFITSKPKRD